MAFWLVMGVDQASERMRQWLRRLPGTGTCSISAAVRSMATDVDTEPAPARAGPRAHRR